MTLTWANLLSALRLGLVPLFALAVFDGRMALALGWLTLAGVTDMLDGFVARSWRQQSRLGAYLDPAADKILLTVAYLLLSAPLAGLPELIPFWVFVLVILRDLIIVVGALVIYLRIGFSRFQPLRLSKWNTAVQIAAVFLVLAAATARAPSSPAHALAPSLAALASAAIGGVAILTVLSGLEYAYRFIYRYGDLRAAVLTPDASSGPP